jgi:hypothetical protein
MKRVIFSLLFFQTVTVLHSFDGSEIGLNLGVFGAGLSSDAGISDGSLFGRFLSFEYRSKSGLGVQLPPLHVSTGVKNK